MKGYCNFYVPALALQATIHSCTRQKGRKDSDGRVQDVGLRIPECLCESTEKYKWNEGIKISNWYLRLSFVNKREPNMCNNSLY